MLAYVQDERVDYSKDSKLHWRNWGWSRIAERLHPKFNADDGRRKISDLQIREACSDKIAIYLLGDKGLDYEVAIRKGFSPYNLIGVDKDRKCVENARNRRRIAICADISELLARWPEHTKFGVVMADYCGGIRNTKGLLPIFTGSLGMSRNCVFLVNCARGAPGERAADLLAWDASVSEIFNSLYPNDRKPSATKHRGLHIYSFCLHSRIIADTTVAVITNGIARLVQLCDISGVLTEEATQRAFEKVMPHLPKAIRQRLVSDVPCFNTNPSSNPNSNVKFDVAVWRNSIASTVRPREIVLDTAEETLRLDRKIRACLAVRTSKMKDNRSRADY